MTLLTLVTRSRFDGDTLAVGAYQQGPDTGAAYVFVRTGTVWSEQQILQASNAGQTDGFGITVSLDGDTLAVGADQERSCSSADGNDDSCPGSGAVYVFVRAAGGSVWSEQQFIKASNAESSDFFGSSVSLDEDTLAVGAYFEGSCSSADCFRTGAVYVFVRGGGTMWSEQQILRASNSGSFDSFGAAVSLNGDTLAVGAYGEGSCSAADGSDDSCPESGAVYVFVRAAGGSVWSEQQFLKVSHVVNPSSDFFGRAVSLHDNMLAVGAIAVGSCSSADGSDDSCLQFGAAYVFVRAAGGTVWSEQQFITASNAESGDVFGSSVALDGDQLAVGAPREDSCTSGDENNNACNDAGAVYLFVRDGAVWSQQQYIKASDPRLTRVNSTPGDFFPFNFGISVALDSDRLAVGDPSRNNRRGAVYNFLELPCPPT